MSDISNNIAILSYLKDKVHKWKNISILLIVILFLLIVRILFGDPIDNIDSGKYIAEIEIKGEIYEDDHRSKILKKLQDDDSAKAVIIKINSPGGSIVGSEILYNELKEIAKKRPIVVLMNSVAASGGYMASMASDHIIAHNGTLTGSIGVLMQSAEMVDLAKKIGVNFKTYKSAPLKASPSPFEKTNGIVNAVVQSSIKDSADFFYELVKESRGSKLKKSDYKEAFDGRVFTGRQALAIGLIDEVGDRNSAIEYLKVKHKIDTDNIEIRKVQLAKPRDVLFDKLSGAVSFMGFKSDSSNKIMAILPF